MEKWNFDDEKNAAVIVNKKIMKEGCWIAYVSHDSEDGVWQFHCNASVEFTESDAMLVALGSVVKLDPSINFLAHLPLGWHAWRASKESEWQCEPQES